MHISRVVGAQLSARVLYHQQSGGLGLVACVAKQRVEEKKTNTTCFSSWSLWEE